MAAVGVWVGVTLVGGLAAIATGDGWASMIWGLAISFVGLWFAAVRGAGGPLTARWFVGGAACLLLLLGPATSKSFGGVLTVGLWVATWVITVELACRSARHTRRRI